MAIWAELKKVVNSNFDKPLNELISGFLNPMYRPDEYMLESDYPDIVVLDRRFEFLANATNVAFVSDLTFDEDMAKVNLKFNFTSTITDGSCTMHAEIRSENDEVLANGSTSVGASGTKDLTVSVVNLRKNTIYKLYVWCKLSWNQTQILNSIAITNSRSFERIVSEEKYPMGKVKTCLFNYSGSGIALSEYPRLDRCEFDYIILSDYYKPIIIDFYGENYVSYVPPWCIMRIKY